MDGCLGHPDLPEPAAMDLQAYHLTLQNLFPWLGSEGQQEPEIAQDIKMNK